MTPIIPEDWTTGVIGFLSGHLPRSGEPEGWDQMASSAYQMGCEALAALGHAEETEWGAVPRKDSKVPEVLPRWDDVCVALLGLAEQKGLLAYRQPDGSVPPPRSGWVVTREGAPLSPAPNVAAAHGLGPAHAAPDVLSVLQELGLIAGGKWTAIAETVLWRDQPRAWNLDTTSDPRFAAAVERAIKTVPDDLRAEMNRIVTINETDVAAALARIEAHQEETRAKFGPKALLGPPATVARARRSLESGARSQLDWLFFRRWRLDNGWLTPAEAQCALGIFHDRLAIAMPQAVVPAIFPGLPFLADGWP